MVTPAAKREAVAHLRSAFDMSERRACRTIDCVRMTVRYRSRRADDADLRQRLQTLAHERRRFGYAILMMLAKLGLLADEVATLTLDDIDWRASEMLVRAKGRQRARMPIPPDVGEAIVAYLRNGRPRSSCRRLFVRTLAPHVGFASGCAITMIAKTALDRVGIEGCAHRGAHIFRHSLATELLRSGATLSEIGQLLRHESHDTTRIYAKVDIEALRTLSLPWPGGAQ
jgi:integrase